MAILRILNLSFRMKPALFLSTFFLSCLMAGSFFFQNEMKKSMMKVAQYQDKEVYFYTLLKKEAQPSWIKSKIEGLPGVLKVKHIDEKNLVSTVSSALTNISDPFIQMVHQYEALRVSLKAGLGIKSYEMVQAYIQRLAGEDKSSIGSLKGDVKVDVPVYFKVIELITYVPYILITFLLTLCAVILVSHISETANVFERYQRENYLIEKGSLVTVLVISLPTVLAFAINPNLLFLILLLTPVAASSLMMVRAKVRL